MIHGIQTTKVHNTHSRETILERMNALRIIFIYHYFKWKFNTNVLKVLPGKIAHKGDRAEGVHWVLSDSRYPFNNSSGVST